MGPGRKQCLSSRSPWHGNRVVPAGVDGGHNHTQMEPRVNAAANHINRSYNRLGDSLAWHSTSALYRVLGPLAERAFGYAADATCQRPKYTRFRSRERATQWPPRRSQSVTWRPLRLESRSPVFHVMQHVGPIDH